MAASQAGRKLRRRQLKNEKERVVRMASALRIIAIDDGHSETKVATYEHGTSGKIVTSSFASRTTDGDDEMSIDGSPSPNVYALIDGDKEPAPNEVVSLAVIDRGRSEWQGTDGGRSPNYAVSDRNRVLVHHALHSASDTYDERRFIIGTTLPYSEFYQPGQTGGLQNRERIEAKKANLDKQVWRFSVGESGLQFVKSPYAVERQAVFPEGSSAFFDCMWNSDEQSASPVLNPDFARRFEMAQDFAVVDIGGKTTDVVIGSWNGRRNDAPKIRSSVSRSLDLGMLGVSGELEQAIMREYGLRKVVDAEQALMNGRISLYNNWEDIQPLVAKCKKRFMSSLQQKIGHELGDLSSHAAVIFVGGGSELMRENIQESFPPGVIVIPENPRFSNARGMLKLLRGSPKAGTKGRS